MALPSLFYNPMFHFHTSTGDLANGGLLFFYAPGTSTKKDTYTTSALSVANANPIILNSRGESTNDVYLNGSYKVVLAPSTDTDPPTASIKTIDNVTGLQQTLSTLAKSVDYTVLAADKDKAILVDASGAARTITLLAAATAGDGFVLNVKKTDSSTNTVTIDGNAAETIDGNAQHVLYLQHDGVTLICNGSNWFILEGHNQTLVDKNGNEVITLGTTTSAVNEVTITNAATATNPSVAASGGDTNVGILVKGKGTGPVQLGQSTSTGVQLMADQPLMDSSLNEYLKFTKATTAVNEFTLTNAATGNSPQLSVTGGDTNIGAVYLTKGVGQHLVNYEDSRTNITAYPLIVRATTSGAAAAGIGTGMIFQAELANGAAATAGSFEFAFDNLTGGAEQTNCTMMTRNNGAAPSLSFAWRRTGTATGAVVWETAATATRTITLPDSNISQHVIQVVKTQTGALATGTTVIPADDTIPQNTEGDEYMTLAITPKNTNNILYITVIANASNSNAGNSRSIVALFQDATANALAAVDSFNGTTTALNNVKLTHTMTAGTTSATTFKVRIGSNAAGTTTFNGSSGARLFGGVMASSIVITEVSP